MFARSGATITVVPARGARGLKHDHGTCPHLPDDDSQRGGKGRVGGAQSGSKGLARVWPPVMRDDSDLEPELSGSARGARRGLVPGSDVEEAVGLGPYA